MKELKQADELLVKIGKLTRALEEMEAKAETEIEKIRRAYAPTIEGLQEKLRGLDRDLVKLMRKNKVKIFDGEDQVNLEHGILLYGREMKVSIPRDALGKIEAQGWLEAIKIAKSVNRGVVEKWPEERLVVIGAELRPKETYSYELKAERE